MATSASAAAARLFEPEPRHRISNSRPRTPAASGWVGPAVGRAPRPVEGTVRACERPVAGRSSPFAIRPRRRPTGALRAAASSDIAEMAFHVRQTRPQLRNRTGGEAMKKLLLAMFLVLATLALAADEKKAAPSDDPMAGWVPPKVTNEAKDKQEIKTLFTAMETAGKRGDLDAAAALVDFPVVMMTDDSKGDAMAEGGWGDMVAAGTHGTASGPQGPASEGTGSAAEGPGSQGTGSGAQSPPERTTK